MSLITIFQKGTIKIKRQFIRFIIKCPRSFDQIQIVSYFMKWVKTSWTYIFYKFLIRGFKKKYHKFLGRRMRYIYDKQYCTTFNQPLGAHIQPAGMQYTNVLRRENKQYAQKLHRSAIAPDTIVVAEIQKVLSVQEVLTHVQLSYYIKWIKSSQTYSTCGGK